MDFATWVFIIEISQNRDRFMQVDIKKLVVSKSKTRPSEDVVAAFELNNHPIVILCDGAGGYGGAREAALECIELVSSHMREHVGECKGSLDDLAYDAIMQACSVITGNDIGQTTVIVAIVTDEKIHITGSGDSKAYLLRDGKMKDLTEYWLKTRVGDSCYPLSTVIDNNGGKVILGSDGLWNYCPVDLVQFEFEQDKPLDDKILGCYERATRYGVFDDFSAVVFDIKKT